MTEYLKRCEEPKRRRKVEGEVISAIQSLWMQEEPSHHLRRFVQCDDEFYFDGYLTGQRIHPHRRSSVPANGIPEYEQQKVRAPIDHPWMFRKDRRGVYHAQQLDDAPDFSQGTKRALQHGQQIDAGDSSVLVGLLGADSLPDLTNVSDPAWFYRTLTGQKEQVPFLNIRNEVRDRLWWRRQNNSELPKSNLGRLIAVGGAGLNRAQEFAPSVLESRAIKGGSYLGAARRAISFWDPVSSPAVTHLRKDRGLVPTSRTVRALSGGI